MNNVKITKIIIKCLLAFIEMLVNMFQDEIGNGEEPEKTDVEKSETQKCYFPMEYLRITQDEKIGSHLNSLAMDFGGKDVFQDVCYAPCDLIVKRVRDNANGEIYFESLSPVLFADGTTDYLHLLMLHDNNTYNHKVGDIIKQNQPFYKEGGMGKGNPTYFANHVHIEAGKGKWTNLKQYPNDNGVYVSENQENLYNLFWLKHGTINLNDINHKFKYET